MLAIAATDDAAVNAAVAAAARERGILVNVVDDGARSDFIFPAIVDRSPLVVAVGTAGSSPTLARRVRAQIEALLPERLGELARYAGRWREAVARALPELPARLRFWDGFFDGPVATRLLAGNARRRGRGHAGARWMQARAAAAAPRGEVYLIGVGPGDPDLLTLRAQQLLQQADVLLHDRLVPEAILGRARRDADEDQRGQDARPARAHAGLHQRAAAGACARRQARGAREGWRSIRVRARRRGTGGAARGGHSRWSWCPASPRAWARPRAPACR